jgi:hypothetical protein
MGIYSVGLIFVSAEQIKERWREGKRRVGERKRGGKSEIM